MGITQLEDQQLAGIVMWIPGGFVYVAAAAIAFLKWLGETEHHTRQPGLRRSAVLPALVASLTPLMLGGCGNSDPPPGTGFGDPAHGRAAILAFGCGSCHTIPGVLNARGLVGPPLDHFANRVYIAGMLRNNPENMVIWLRYPQTIVPGNAMPNMGLTERDARDIAAYLFTLD
ncbi:MAG: cytochrome c oxidase assembly protein [Alphaproteobacteria bacterium]|nr:cytochrome c oxidase assembly protein [Alphaproteobacteria bacterium]